MNLTCSWWFQYTYCDHRRLPSQHHFSLHVIRLCSAYTFYFYLVVRLSCAVSFLSSFWSLLLWVLFFISQVFLSSFFSRFFSRLFLLRMHVWGSLPSKPANWMILMSTSRMANQRQIERRRKKNPHILWNTKMLIHVAADDV